MKRQARIVLAVLLVAFVALVGQSSAQEMGRYIVTIEGHPGPAEQAVLRAGGAVNHVYNIIPAIAIQIPEQALEGLKRNPNVVTIEPDIMVYAIDAELDNSWGVKRIGAGVVHDSGNKGAGAEVAILDTGIDRDHPDLVVAVGINFVPSGKGPPWARTVDPDAWDDDNGHGTHCAGIVAALDNGIGVVGVAPDASLSAVKVLDNNGSGYVSDIIAGLEWCVAKNKDVANMSLGADSHVQAFQDACDEASEAGLLLVAAAGNDGSSVDYPAAYDSVIAVSATDISDGIASFSDYGPEVELSAPGVSIYSTYMGGGYATGSGTSMAAPHVAGTAALVIAANIGSVRTRLQNTAEDLGDADWDQYYGHGLVDADEAVGVSEEPVTDIAITEIIAPSSVEQGTEVKVDVIVDNVGNQDVTNDITVTLISDNCTPSVFTDDITIGTLLTNGDLLPDLLTFTWYTSGASIGDHTLTASHDFFDGDPDNDSLSTTVKVTQQGATSTMHVADITMTIKKAGRNVNAIATVTIKDAGGAPVAGATVSGTWSGATSDSDVGTTDTLGKITLQSNKIKNASSGTTFTFTVDNVVKSGWTYDFDANVETSDSIPVP